MWPRGVARVFVKGGRGTRRGPKGRGCGGWGSKGKGFPLPLVKKILKILTSEGAFLDHFANLSEQKFLSKKRILFLIAYWYVHTAYILRGGLFFYRVVKIARAREIFFASLEIFCPHPLDFRLRGARKIYRGSKNSRGAEQISPLLNRIHSIPNTSRS